LDSASERAAKKASQTGFVNLTVTGAFEGPGHHGHLNGYEYRFTAHTIKDMAVIVKGMKSLDEEKAAEKRWARGGKDPK
jgi:hypothetical protein